MDVENYTTDLGAWNPMQNRYGIKRQRGTIGKRAYERIVREARQMIAESHGIDWTAYGEGVAIFSDMTTCQVEWAHRSTGAKLTLTRVFFDDRTGEIHQCGTEHGDLVF